ncbi:DUF1501 domain-containing protein [Rubinisphaera italica]|uniref:DUF1501 domain-containing protein n=1 Tax=Rubinisphaera italica TaxID=2527969 RepID=A0A5C5XIG7_9PLAN|nr:DUF1501 domain-containing protein [Rubinisphaera italica]TWT62574.1 hypothetical protein Pan54_33170 [Rubinisphaera italica]
MWNRRDFMKATAATAAGTTLTPNVMFGSEAEAKHALQLGKAEHCIMLWLGGGAAQMDTFDPKRVTKDGLKDPGSAYPAIDTVVPGVQLCEHLPNMAKIMDRCTVVRSVHHDVIDEHAAASYRMHIGRPTSGTIIYPALGSVITNQKEPISHKVPQYVLMGQPTPGRQPGFLGAEYGFVYLTDTRSGPKGLSRPPRITTERQSRRESILADLTRHYEKSHADEVKVQSYLKAVKQGFDLAGPEFMSVFDLDREPADLRNAYGEEFGQRCLLARRLVERGTRFVEVSFNLTFVNGTGWDTHREGQKKQHLLIQSLDKAFSALVTDLEEKNLLNKTLICISSEFGRPASFDGAGGRGHHSKAFSTVLAGGGLQHGRAVGETDELAQKIVGGRSVTVPDWFATIFATMGIEPHLELYAGDRPVPITDGGVPIEELFAKS